MVRWSMDHMLISPLSKRMIMFEVGCILKVSLLNISMIRTMWSKEELVINLQVE